MTDIPDCVTLEWLARHLVDFREETKRDIRSLRNAMDLLVLAVVRLDHTVEGMRADLQTLWPQSARPARTARTSRARPMIGVGRAEVP